MKELKTIDNYGKYGNYDNWRASEKDDIHDFSEDRSEIDEDRELERYYLLMNNPFC